MVIPEKHVLNDGHSISVQPLILIFAFLSLQFSFLRYNYLIFKILPNATVHTKKEVVLF